MRSVHVNDVGSIEVGGGRERGRGGEEGGSGADDYSALKSCFYSLILCLVDW